MRLAGIILFFLALCLPAFKAATGRHTAYAIDENRKLAAAPTIEQFHDPVSGFQQLERYFDDHYGFRDFLIRLKTQIDFTVFHTSDKVHLGKDGWLFYRSVLDVEKPATERYLAANTGALTNGIENLAAALKRRGQTLVLMPVFLGDVFYPEKLPGDVPKLPWPSGFYSATEKWKQLPNLVYIDSAAVLWSLKQRRQIFHKTDFHWNSPAAFAVARAMVDQLGVEAGLADPPVWDHKLEIERRPYIGRESDFLPLFKQPSELGLFVKPTWKPDVRMQTNQGIFEYVSSKTVDDGKTLPPLCLVGDSFSDGLLESGFTSYFKNVYRVRWQGADTLPKALAKFPPECHYIMVEFIEIQAAAFDSLVNGAANLPPQRLQK